MASVAPISGAGGEIRPVSFARPLPAAARPDATSAREDRVELSAEAVQLIQAAAFTEYESPESNGGNDAGESQIVPDSSGLQLVG
jgi:hypothetical protein